MSARSAEGGAPRWGERRTATFAPTRTDDLRPEALPLIGQTREWEFEGTMDEGPYCGQAIWTLIREAGEPWVGWFPDEDLTSAIPPESSADARP